ncbi:MAG: adenine deaminase [Deltaproteobacteria bacterium]|nr:MAG: adenine deaminase [Deltaproteobacteria bacterium]
MEKSESVSLISVEDKKELIQVALGREAADLTIINANLVNVYTGEIFEGHAVCVKKKWIAYVGDKPEDKIGKETEVIDAGGSIVIPGLIDGHTHLAWMYSVSEFLKYAMTGGTTSLVTETMEPFPVTGYAGIADFLESMNDQPIKIFATAPFMASISQKARGISTETLSRLLARNTIIGLGESYWQSVLQEPDRMLPVFNETLRFGKTLEGHSAGATGNKLNAYIAAGITSCHEPIRTKEVLERLRLGMYVMVREGSIRRDLEAISKIKETGIDLRLLILVTDGVGPKDLLEKGCMEFVVQKAIDCGFDPIAAIQMATLNVAEHFSLDHLIGGLAPGRYADMVIIPDIHTIEALYVISNGRVIAHEGRRLVSPREHQFSHDSQNSIHLSKTFEASDFRVSAPQDSGEVAVRIIDMITDLVTREIGMALSVTNGEVKADLDRDIIKVAAIDRTHVPGKTFIGFLKGFNLKAGAFACSAAWDTSDIIVAGADDADMATAVNRIHDLQGGAVVCKDNTVLSEVPLPVFGIISTEPMEILARQLEEIKQTVAELGVRFPDPLLTIITLTGAAIPYLRICEEGLVNLKDGKTIGLFVN